MTVAADIAALKEPPAAQCRRWGSALAAILAFHASAVAAVTLIAGMRTPDGPPPAPIMISLAPLPVAPETRESDLAIGLQQVEAADAEPVPDKPVPEKIIKARDAEIPKPVARPKHERKREKPAPATTAPQAAPLIASAPAAPLSGAGSREADAMTEWQARLRAHLERYKRYPREARQRGEAGEAILRFVVDRHGNVLDSALARSSGVPALDRETLEMIRRAAPLPPMPPEVAGQEKGFTIPVRFGLT